MSQPMVNVYRLLLPKMIKITKLTAQSSPLIARSSWLKGISLVILSLVLI